MPIGIVSDSDLELELQRLNRSKKSDSKESHVVQIPEIVDIEKAGRKSGDVNVPDSLRQIIGETHLTDGRNAAIQLAEEFGISKSSVSAYAKGATSTTSYNQPSPSILNHIKKSRERAVKKASRTLNQALESISQEKLDHTDAKDLSVIAKNMSGIIKDLVPDESSDPASQQSSQPQFVIFAPQFRDERTFEHITVQE